MKKLFVAGILAIAALGVFALATSTPASAARKTCANARCVACQDGYHLPLQWPDCCACVKN